MKDFLIQNIRLLITTAAVAVIVSVLVILFVPFSSKYDVSFSVSIARELEGSGDEYAYGGYYVIQAAESITDMVQQWLRTPEVVSAITKHAGIQDNAKRLSDLESRFFVRKRGAQYVEVRMGLDDASEASALASAVEVILRDRLLQLGLHDAQGRFNLIVSDPVVLSGRPPLGASTFIAATIAVFLVGLWQLANPPQEDLNRSKDKSSIV